MIAKTTVVDLLPMSFTLLKLRGFLQLFFQPTSSFSSFISALYLNFAPHRSSLKPQNPLKNLSSSTASPSLFALDLIDQLLVSYYRQPITLHYAGNSLQSYSVERSPSLIPTLHWVCPSSQNASSHRTTQWLSTLCLSR